MIKRLYILLILAGAFAGCKNGSSIVSGTLEKPVKGEFLYLFEYGADELIQVDSIKMKEDGKFSFEREIKVPTLFLIKTSNINFFQALLEPGEKLQIEAIYDSLNNPTSLSGSAGTEKMVEYNKALKNTVSKLMSLNEIYQNSEGSPDMARVIQSLDSMANQYLNEINIYTKRYIDENIKSLASLVALYQQVAPQIYILNPEKDLRYFVKVDSSLFSSYPESAPVKTLHEQVQALVGRSNPTSLINIGDIAPEISLPAPDGKFVNLSSTRGKVVLLDFWAAWCGPCRQENPNLVSAYNKYAGKGFTIFQVSLDKTKEAWLKGIQDDNLSQWTHVSDLKYWNSVVVPMYKIESIPHSLLLDKEGKIIAMDLRGALLEEKLAEIFK